MQISTTILKICPIFGKNKALLSGELQILRKKSFKGIVTKTEIFKNPDNGIESEKKNVNNAHKVAQKCGQVVSFGHVNLFIFVAFNVDNEGLGITDSVFTGDIKSDKEIRVIKQIITVKVKGCFAVCDVFTKNNIAV